MSGGRASSALPSMCKTLSQLDTGSEGLSKKSQQTQFVCEVPTLSCLKGREGPKNTHIQFTALNTNIPGCYGVCSTCRWARVCVCVCVCLCSHVFAWDNQFFFSFGMRRSATCNANMVTGRVGCQSIETTRGITFSFGMGRCAISHANMVTGRAGCHNLPKHRTIHGIFFHLG